MLCSVWVPALWPAQAGRRPGLHTDDGRDVTVFRRGESPCDTRIRHIHGDRSHLPRDLSADLVIDMWCMTEEHARGLVDQFGRARLVVMSSGDAYRHYSGLCGVYTGPPDPTPLAENAPLRETLYPYRFMSMTIN